LVFSSVIFLLYFLPVVLAVNYLLPKTTRNYWLLLSSFLFYAWGAPQFVFILSLSVIANFGLVKVMHDSTHPRARNILLGISVAINVGLLMYFKYANFFVENVNSLLASIGIQALTWTSVALPIGISFFTFQSLTYSVDVYRKMHEPLKKLTDYALYIMLFPQMIAGPIVRFYTIADQLVDRTVTHEHFKQGGHRFVIGLAKKVLIANTVAEFAAPELLGSDEVLSSTSAWIGILAYTFQIYFDFSGYSDMAIGLGRMMGFNFPENFNNPYTSGSITEFWRRWHITLGVWMRDYLYIPLGGNKVSSMGRLYFNLIFVFLVSGLWHGASWNFVIWGCFHGLFLVIERLFLARLLKQLPKPVSVIYCFTVVVVGWVFFSIETFDAGLEYLETMFSFQFGPSKLLLNNKFTITMIVAAVFSFFTLLPQGKQIQDWFFGSKSKPANRALMNALVIIMLLYSFMHLIASGFNPFIYFRF